MAYTTIDDPSAHFQVTIYTGNGGSQDITNSGNSDLQPDMLWIKQRSSDGSVSSHVIKDSTRGVTKEIYPNAANAEGTSSLIDELLTDGFSINNTANEHYNYDGGLYVSYQWKANGGTTVSVSASGSGASQVLASTHQANTTSGFSIVRFTGVEANATVTHGLGAVPEMILFKNIISSNNWIVYHKGMGNDDGAYLNLTNAEVDNVAFFNDTTPTTSVFSVGTNDKTNDDGSNSMIAYCFTSIQGYSKFGSYTGNGNADGPFVYTGFKPRWIVWKMISSSGDWDLYDTARDTYNLSIKEIPANETNDESSADVLAVDILSNGFKLRTSNANGNADAGTYIYAAFAEQPFVTSGGVPCTAR